MGAGYLMANDVKDTSDYVLQRKTLFKDMETNGWGIGLAIGKVYNPDVTPSANQLGSTYAYIPFSASFKDDKVIMHLNVGLLRDNESNKDLMTWGIGGEFEASSRLAGVLEVYGDQKSTPFVQSGLRFYMIQNLHQLDATLGGQLNGVSDNQYMSIGVRFTPDWLF